MNTQSVLHILFVSLVVSVMLISPVQAASPEPAAQHVMNIHTKGDSDITNRITLLNGLISKVATAKKLTANQKSSLKGEMQGEVASLTTLKITLDSETTVAAATTDFKNIFAEHYIFAFYLPRVDRIIAADNESDASALLIALAPKLETYLTIAQGKGIDITTLQSELTDMQTQASDAQDLATGVISTLTPLLASGYPNNKSAVSISGTSIKTAQSELLAARADTKEIVSGLRSDMGTRSVQ